MRAVAASLAQRRWWNLFNPVFGGTIEGRDHLLLAGAKHAADRPFELPKTEDAEHSPWCGSQRQGSPNNMLVAACTHHYSKLKL